MNLRIRLIPTKRTDVLCMACGSFHADHVLMLTSGVETNSGVHKKCVDETAAKFTRKKRSQPVLDASCSRPRTGT